MSIEQELLDSQKAKQLPRPVWILSFVSFFADVSSEMVYPLLPLFVISVLGSSMTQLGAMEGGAVLIVALMSAIAGIRSDRRQNKGGRVKWIRWGYGLPVLGKALIAAASAWPLALGGRLLDRFGKGLRGAPRDALIADAVPKELRGRAFGLHRGFDTAGAVVGVLLSAFLLWWLTGAPQSDVTGEALGRATETPAWVYRTIFGVGAVLGLASYILTFLLDESPSEKGSDPLRRFQNTSEIEPPPKGQTPFRMGSESGTILSESLPITSSGAFEAERAAISPAPRKFWSGLPASYWYVLAILVLFSLANSSDTFLLLRARDLGYTPWGVVLVYALYNVFYSVLSYPAGALSDKIGRWRMIVVGWLIYASAYVGFALLPVSQAWAMWPLMAIYGIYMALTDGIGKALIADHAPSETRGAAMGLFYGLTGLTTLLASLLAGLIWDRFGATPALLCGSGFTILALIALLLFGNRLVAAKQP